MSRTVLVVDDDEDQAKMLGLALAQAGYNVVYAYDGLGATTAARKHAPDLIVTDIQMPAASGVTVYERLKRSPETACKPVIFVSALSPAEVAAQVVDARNIRFLSKPVDLKKLAALAKELLSSAA